MKINYNKSEISFEKELNSLDKFTVEFTSILNSLKTKYVIISGYIPILFGRNRNSEDIDIIVEKISFETFEKLWNNIHKTFECIITNDAKDAYNEYLLTDLAIRFAKKNNFIPNIEFKFPKVELDLWTLNERKKVVLNNHQLFISPLELQIPFKLYLGSEKDIEDAKYLYNLFSDKLDSILLIEFNRKLKTEKLFNKFIK